MRTHTKLLNERDRQIISLIAEGHSYHSISQILGTKEFTVKRHVWLMMKENGFTTPYQLITWVYQDAIIV